MTEEGADVLEPHLEYRYSWAVWDCAKDDIEAKNMSEDFLEVLVKYGNVTGFIPAYSIRPLLLPVRIWAVIRLWWRYCCIFWSWLLLLCLQLQQIIPLQKASVIGTLRASGYTRKRTLFHYISMPVIVTVVASVLETCWATPPFKDLWPGMYYGSYSLPTYETRWNADAFILTTVVPVVIMLGINLILISRKLRLSLWNSENHDLSSSNGKKAVHLPDFKFFNRFRLRIIMQNKSSYLTLFINLFANVLLLLEWWWSRFWSLSGKKF